MSQVTLFISFHSHSIGDYKRTRSPERPRLASFLQQQEQTFHLPARPKLTLWKVRPKIVMLYISHPPSLVPLFLIFCLPTPCRSKWHYVGGPFAHDLEVSHKLFVLSPNNKYLVTAGHWDNSLRVHSIERTKITARVLHHNGNRMQLPQHSANSQCACLGCLTVKYLKKIVC